MEETIPYLYFVQHGHFCASRPLEVIAATVTTTIFLFHYLALVTRKYASFHEGSIFTMWPKEFATRSANHHSHETGSDQMHVALITLTRCLSLLYCYYQLQTVQRSFSKPVAGITSLFAIVSAVAFSAGLVNVLQLQVTELGDVIMFYLLWMDLSNVSQLVRMGVRTSENFQQNTGIGNILGRLGPVMTFDSAIKILVISIGFISGVRQLEILAFLSLLAIVVNYIIFMTIFPASLSMIVEVTRKKPKATVSKSVSFTPATLSSCNLHSPPAQLQTQSTSNSSSQNVIQQSYSQSKIPGVVQPPQPSSQSLNGILSSTSTLPAIITTGTRTQPSNHNYHQLLQQQLPFPDTANYNNKLLVQVLKLVIGATFLLQQSYGYWRFPVDPSNVDFTTNTDRASASSGEKMLSVNNGTDEASQLSDAYSLIISVFFLRVDQIVILSLILVLSLKYIFYDSKVEPSPPVPEDSSSNTSAPKEAAPVQRVLPLPVLNKKSQMNHLSRSASLTEEEAMELLSRPNPVKKTDSLPVHISFTVGESESDSDLEGSRKTSVVLDSKGIQTLESFIRQDNTETNNDASAVRSLQECIRIYNSQEEGAQCLTDAEVVSLVDAKTIPAYQLEKAVQDEERGVVIRRKLIGRSSPSANNAFNEIPYKHYDYSKITGACCENVVGYIPVPVGVVGPLNLDGKMYHVPMATTEGCLVASTNRGCRALSNGVNCRVVGDGMTRGPVVRFPSAVRACEASIWLNDQENYEKLKESFDCSSRFARLQNITCRSAGRYLFIRFVAKTGDAMGMNMISKGTEISLKTLQTYFCDMEILSLSGNFCTDKKPAAVNWIEGRGKSVVSEAVVPAHIVHNVLKTSAAALVELNIAKNLVGSAMAGSIGGYNAHAANIVAAIFIATGQDTAQCVGSSNCITLMETWGVDNQDLYISCTMPSIEVGTIGGGTCLPAQTACLSMLGVQGPHSEEPGENARALARVVCATVLAGELSLMSALAAGHLVRSHLKHNRSSANVDATATMRMVATSPAAFPTSTSLHPPSLSPNSGAPSELIPKILTSNHHNNNWNSSSISTLRLNDSSKNIESNKMDYESRLTTTATTDRGNNNKFEAENFCAQSHYSTSTIKVPSSVPVPETSAVITNNCIQLTSTSASLSSAVPPKSMDLLSVPTECKQF